MSARMYDLAWQIEGDNIRLTQDNGCGEVSTVDLHPCQLRLLAERAGLLSPAPAVEWPRGFERRLLRLQTDIGYLADDVWVVEICERLSDGLAYRIGINAALDTINDLLLDTGILPDNGENDDEATRDDPCARTDGQTSEAPGQQPLC